MKAADPIDTARLSLALTDLRLPAIKLVWPDFAARSDKEGWPDRALAESDRALAEAAAGGHKVTLALAQYHAAALHELRREPQRVAKLAADSVATSREQGSAFYLAIATILHGWALVRRGDAGAISSIPEGLEALQKTGALLCLLTTAPNWPTPIAPQDDSRRR